MKKRVIALGSSAKIRLKSVLIAVFSVIPSTTNRKPLGRKLDPNFDMLKLEKCKNWRPRDGETMVIY